MNFSSIFKSISNFQFPYSLEDEPIHTNALWKVFKGTRKSDSLPVTAFKARRTPENEKLILNAVHKSKVIKIPGLCHVLETFDSDPNATFIVTESIVPFPWDDIKTLNKNKEGIQLGISQILDTMNHMTQFVLANLSPESIYINAKGQLVLFGLELCQDRKNISTTEFSNDVNNYYRCMGKQILSSDPKFVDSITLAQLIKDLYLGTLPNDWQKFLSSSNSMQIGQLISKFKSSSTWISNPLIQLYQELKEIHIKDNHGKLVVMVNLQNLFFDYPQFFKNMVPNFIEGLLIPEICANIDYLLKQQHQATDGIENTISKIVPLLSILLSFVNDLDLMTEPIKNIIFHCFRLQDRQVRFLLLIYLEKIISKLQQNEISNKIFNHFAQGLADSEKTMRLQTLKKIPIVVPHLTERQLNNELLRFLAKTQVDQDIEIRTWTILIMVKISKDLSSSSNTRANILATVFTKSLKDPDLKPRLAALYGLQQSIDLFDIYTIANKILTVIAPGLLDKTPLVRKKAKILFNKYLSKLESEAQAMHLDDTDNDEDSIDIDFTKYQIENDDIVQRFMSNLKINIPTINSLEDDIENHSNDFNNDNDNDDAWIQNDNNDDSVDGGWGFDNDDSNNNGWDDDDTNEEIDDGWGFSSKPTNITNGSSVKIKKSWNDELNEEESDTIGKIKPPAKLSLGKRTTSSILSNHSSTTSIRTATSIRSKPVIKKASSKAAFIVDDDDVEDGWDDF